jgi:enoyl-CoA hydratase/carnithine racemase
MSSPRKPPEEEHMTKPNVTTTLEKRPEGEVACITWHNAPRLNVLDRDGMEALTAAIRALMPHQGLRALVLRGEGEKAFIGGADIRAMVGLDPTTARGFITALHRVCAAIRALHAPVIARMAGYTLGAGLEIAAACDLRVAAEDARMGMPEVRIGIPSVIEAALLPSLIGWGRTRRMLLTGEMVEAPTALIWGLVEEVVPGPELDAAIERLLVAILAGSQAAVRAQKRLIRDWEEATTAEATARGIDAFAAAWTSAEPVRRMQQFLTRRRA